MPTWHEQHDMQADLARMEAKIDRLLDGPGAGEPT